MKRKILRIITCLLVSCAALGPPGRPALGQGQGRDYIDSQLKRLDRQIAFASQVVASFANANAADLLRQARQHRSQARSLLDENRPLMALAEINEGLRLAEMAVKAALESTLQRLRSQLEEKMRRAEIEVIGSGNRQAEQLLQRAKKKQSDAELALRAMAYLEAIQHLRLAIDLVDQSLKAVKGNRLNTASAEDERKQFENLAARAREAVEAGANASARAIYEQAMKQARTAEEALRNGNTAMALQLYYGATRLLLRAIDLAGPNPVTSTSRLESELALLQDLIHSAEKQIDATSDSRGAMLIGRARVLAEEARRALERKNEPEAEWRLTLARRFVSKAMRAEARGSKIFESRLDDELAQLGEDLKELDQRAREQENSDALELVALARLAAGKAERASEKGRPRVALQAVLAAQRFLANAETMLSKSGSRDLDRNEVSQKLERLDASLQEVSQTVSASGNEVALELLRQVTEIRDSAREAYNRGRLRVANESAGVALEMLQTVVKISKSGNKP
jgi:hypothetical protein